MARIITLYVKSPKERDHRHQSLVPVNMAYIRWFKISEGLARLGHNVDMAMPDQIKIWPRDSEHFNGQKVGRVPLSEVRWDQYDVVKTLFHKGFETLEAYGGTDHPFIISKLGSVVGPQDLDGIYFYGKTREQLYATQERINRTSKYVTVISESAKSLWTDCFGPREDILVVPGAADHFIPPPRRDPYPNVGHQKKILFAGNVYRVEQPEANEVLIAKLNRLGKLLAEYNARLYMIGSGDVSRLDERYVTHLGAIPYLEAWDYFHYADIGVVVAPGSFHHNNESTKIYHYLRVGLPVVSEAGFPNDQIVVESKLGFVVESGNLELMARKVVEALHKDWDREHAISFILNNHTWDKRAESYDKIFKEDLSQNEPVLSDGQ